MEELLAFIVTCSLLLHWWYWFYTRLPKHLYFTKKHPMAIIPHYASQGAAGCDLSACLPESTQTLYSQQTTVVPTGLVVAVPDGMEMQIRSRSGFAKRGIVVANAPGTLDSDYRGEVHILIWNRNQHDIVISHGTRLAQAVFAPVSRLNFVPTNRLSETKRGTLGFGSTGF